MQGHPRHFSTHAASSLRCKGIPSIFLRTQRRLWWGKHAQFQVVKAQSKQARRECDGGDNGWEQDETAPLSAVSYRYMGRKRGLDSGERRWPSFSTIMCKRSVSSSWTGNCHAFMVLHAELTLSQRGITAPPSIRDIDMANKFDAASMFA